MEKQLKGKTAIVTGASRGIGKAISLVLAMHGANVAVNYFESKEKAEAVVKEIEAKGVKAIAVKADVSNTKE
ncbi:MAG: SDR family NAD(P)-dependent oxidoreductase, partial [archaeon]|nr:SDR family NAD(P)-dependent oxidoreductase [archaeon]